MCSFLLENPVLLESEKQKLAASSVTWLWPLANLQHILETQQLQSSKTDKQPHLQDKQQDPQLVSGIIGAVTVGQAHECATGIPGQVR